MWTQQLTGFERTELRSRNRKSVPFPGVGSLLQQMQTNKQTNKQMQTNKHLCNISNHSRCPIINNIHSDARTDSSRRKCTATILTFFRRWSRASQMELR